MTHRTLITALALLAATPAAAAGAETIRYDVRIDLAGTWAESVRAGLDPDDADHDGTEEVPVRDTALRFALGAGMRDVRFTDGLVTRPRHDVADGTLTQELLSSSYTDWDGDTGSCGPQSAAATGGGTLAAAAGANVFRSSGDAPLDLECHGRFAAWSFRVDLLRVAAAPAVPALGQAPVDATFTVPARRFGDARIAIPVAASPQQQAFERCPREDPGHTVACPFDWSGTVTLDRVSPLVRAPRRAGRKVRVDVTCFRACRPVLRAGGRRATFRLAAGERRRLSIELRRAGRPVRLSVAAAGERHRFTVR